MNTEILQCVRDILPEGYTMDWFVYDLGYVYVSCGDESIQREVLFNSIKRKPTDFVDYCSIIKDSFTIREYIGYTDELVVSTACRRNVQHYAFKNCYYEAIHQHPMYLPMIALNRLMSSESSGIITAKVNNVFKYIDEVNYVRSQRL